MNEPISTIISEPWTETLPETDDAAEVVVSDSRLSGRNLRATDIHKCFGAMPVLHGVSLDVRSGEFITLLGPSGCGKTTLLRILAGLETADSGRIRLGEHDLTGLPANRRPVNTVFQNYALFPHLNVFDNVAFGLRARRTSPEDIRRRVADALSMLQLDGFEKRNVHQLSGGQKQRVALARALVNEPEVLLLDEPMSALDAKLRAEVQIELRRLQRRLGRTFLLVTHDQNEAMTVSDRLFVMKDGRIEQSGSPTEVYEHPSNRFVAEFLGLAILIPVWHQNGGLQSHIGPLVSLQRPAWEHGTLAIRPERIQIRASKPKQNGVRARVTEVIHHGTHLDVFVEPKPLRLRVMAGTRVEPGEKIWLELPGEHLEVLRD